MSKNHTKNSVNYLSFWWLLVPCLVGSGLYVYGVFSMVSSIAAVLSSVVVILPLLIYRILKSIPVRNKKEDNNPQLKMMGLPDDLLKVIHSYLTPKESLALTSVEYGLRNNPVLLSHTLRKIKRSQSGKVMTIENVGNSLLVSTGFGLWFRYDQGFDVEQITTFPVASNLKIHPKQVLLAEHMLFILGDQGRVYSGILGDYVGSVWLKQWLDTDKVSRMMGRVDPKRDYEKMEIVPLPKAQKIAVSIELEIVVALTNKGLYLWGPDSHRILNIPNDRQNNPTKIFIPGGYDTIQKKIVDFALRETLFTVLTEDALYAYDPINGNWSGGSPTRNGRLLGMHLNPLLLYTFLVRENSVVAYDSRGQSSLLAVNDPLIDLPNVTHLDTDILESSFSELYTTDAKVVFRTSNAVYTCWYHGVDRMQNQTLFEIEARKEELPPIRQMQAAYDAVYFLCEGGTVHQYHYATEGMKKVEFPEPILSLRPRAYGRRYNLSFERGQLDSYQVVACTELSLYGIRYPDDQGNMKIIEIRTLNTTVQALKKKLKEKSTSVFSIFRKNQNEMFLPALKMLEDEMSSNKTKQPGL